MLAGCHVGEGSEVGVAGVCLDGEIKEIGGGDGSVVVGDDFCCTVSFMCSTAG